jgi:hypothetical protein
MALSNFTELKSSIASWIHRNDLTAVIPDFIKLAESRMSLELDVDQLQKTATITTVSGTDTAPLPSDFRSLIDATITMGSILYVLDKMPAQLLRTRWGSYTSNIPQSYAILNNKLKLGPIPNGNYDIVLEYNCTIPSLSDSNPTNDLLTAYPDMYLHCCLIYAATYIRDAEMVGGMESLYNADKERANIANWNQDAAMATKQG